MLQIEVAMKECELCRSVIPCKLKIDGKIRNLQRRRYCLLCSPFGAHNTKKLGERGNEAVESKYVRWQRKARKERKGKLIAMLGGKCIRCGYSKCTRSLCFHHILSEKKSFTLSSHGLLHEWEAVLEEAKKCDLLCSNCHGELHEALDR